MNSLKDSIDIVREKIADACSRAGRHENDVLLIGVTKGVDSGRIKEAAELGINDFGENYIQEARRKIEVFQKEVNWHMIGYIQSNKIKYIPRLFQWVHSVDRFEILESLERFGKRMKVLLEVNLSGEASKHGTAIDNVRTVLEKAKNLQYIEPVGLMTMAPYVDNPEDVRWIFKRLRELMLQLNREFALEMKELSMGMSSDYEVAIEEGATMVRIGTAIFGAR